MWFSSEAMTKGYQAYRDSWATVLSEEMLCLREVVIDVKTRRRSVTLRRHGQLPRPAYAKIKTAKIYSKVNTAFSRILHQRNFPLYHMVAIFHGYTPSTHSSFPRRNQLWFRCCPQDVTHMHDEIKLTRPSPIPVLEYCKR